MSAKLIRLNDSWWVDAALVSAVRLEDKNVVVYFHEGGNAVFPGALADVTRIAAEINAARETPK